MILVTGNLHKLEEFKRLAPSISWEALGAWEDRERGARGPEIIEDADSFVGNAILKAREGWRRTGLTSLADDSGLCVDALDGAPGIYSARYAVGSDVDRYQALLKAMEEVPDPDRTAHFTCAIAICGLSIAHRERLEALIPPHTDSTNTPLQEGVIWREGCLVVIGQCQGMISRAPTGERGFGYDPIFKLIDGRSFAKLSGVEKDTYSHRGEALRTLTRFCEEKNIHFS